MRGQCSSTELQPPAMLSFEVSTMEGFDAGILVRRWELYKGDLGKKQLYLNLTFQKLLPWSLQLWLNIELS